jgi:antitoxin component of MazEF toxin-antitoxin module
MPEGEFRARLIRPTGVGTWTFAPIPERVRDALKLRARLRVTGTIDGAPFRSSLMPRGGGSLFVVVPQALREQIQKSQGQVVDIALRLDARPVRLVIPPDLRRALGDLRPRFEALTPSRRKAFLEWIASAKRPETRARRLLQSVEMVRRGENRN